MEQMTALLAQYGLGTKPDRDGAEVHLPRQDRRFAVIHQCVPFPLVLNASGKIARRPGQQLLGRLLTAQVPNHR